MAAPPLTWIDRADAGKLSVTGPDALGFLQAHLSADLRTVEVGRGTSAALLTARGQVRALLRLLRIERGWLLHCERPALDGLFRGLWSGRVGWQVELGKLTLQQGLATVLDGAPPAGCGVAADSAAAGDAAAAAAVSTAGDAVASAAAFALGLPELADAPEHAHLPTALGGVPVRAVRTWAGIDLLARADRVPALLDAVRAVGAAPAPLDAGDWDALRIERGRIAYGADATDAMLPAELALAPELVATDKGLYPGLQTVLRQQRSGTVHRRLCRLRAPVLLAPGDELHAGAGGPLAGTVRTAVCFDGLAVLRTRDLDGPLVHAPSGATVAARPLERAAPSL